MKKILTHLTGIVFLIAILIAGGCSAAKPKKVEIYCKAVNINGAMHFEMFDKNDTTKVAVNPSKEGTISIVVDHTTDVFPMSNVTWQWANGSDVDKFLKIKPKKYGKIMKKDPEQVPETHKYKLKIPEDAPRPSSKEKYEIIFLNWNQDTVIIDPYLKIPPP